MATTYIDREVILTCRRERTRGRCEAASRQRKRGVGVTYQHLPAIAHYAFFPNPLLFFDTSVRNLSLSDFLTGGQREDGPGAVEGSAGELEHLAGRERDQKGRVELWEDGAAGAWVFTVRWEVLEEVRSLKRKGSGEIAWDWRFGR